MTQAPPPASPPAVGTSGRSFGFYSLVVTVCGAVAAVIGMTAVKWNSLPVDADGNNSATFFDYRQSFLGIARFYDALRADQANPGPFPTTANPDNEPVWQIAYFSWVGIALLVLLFALAILAAFPTPVATIFRVLGVVAALASIGGALFVSQLDTGPGIRIYLEKSVGAYFVAVGSLLMGIGAAIGPRKKVSS